ncbi:DUF1800 domain-containing protein [bacterium]|nr:DUF1800 domain-containing protein [bacterium]
MTVLPYEAAAGRRSIKITKKTAGQFSSVGGKKMLCRARNGTFELGRLKGKKKVGGRFIPLREPAFERKIARLERIEVRLSRKKKRRRKLKVVRRRLRKQEATLERVRSLLRECADRSTQEGEDARSSLEPYRDDLTEAEITHLLNKVAFGGTAELRRIGREDGLAALVDALVDGVTTPEEDHRFRLRLGEWEALGRHRPERDDRPEEVWTFRGIQSSQLFQMVESRNPFHDWMFLQLSAHFATDLDSLSFSFNGYRGYGLKAHVELLREHAVGNFRSLVVGMLTDQAMNVWLGNKDNTVVSPNQNFARELLELFTLGAIDPFTLHPNYDEETIVAATGFVSGYQEDFGSDPELGNDSLIISFFPAARDNTPRTAFAGIPGAELQGSPSAEQFIDHILYRHPGAARYIAERLAGNMLYPGISEEMGNELAALLISSRYRLKPFLRKILRSKAMFSQPAKRSCISSPVEHFVKLARRIFPTGLSPSGGNWSGSLGLYASVARAAEMSGQELFSPPSVFGWKQSCNINRNGEISRGEAWLSSQLLQQRTHGCAEIFNALNGEKVDFRERFSLDEQEPLPEMIRRLALQVYDLELTTAEVSLLEEFLRSYTDESRGGEVHQFEPNFQAEWYLRQKMPALICAMGTVYRVALR